MDTSTLQEERADSFIRLAEFYMEIRENRRKMEWKVSFGIWGALLVVAYNFKEQLANTPWDILAIIAVIVAFLHMRLWIWPMFVRNESDARIAYYFESRAERYASGNEGEPMGRA